MTTAAVQTNLNVVWTLIAAILVFMMQAGFALVETGFTRAKNAANIMMKNLMDFAAGSLAFYILGAALMFGASKAAGWLGWGGLGMPQLATGEGVWDWTKGFLPLLHQCIKAPSEQLNATTRIHILRNR